MSNVELRLPEQAWRREPGDTWLHARHRAERLLPGVWSAALLSVDGLLVVGAFLLAHWVRFVAPSNDEAAMEFASYLRMAFGIGAVAVGLFAYHGLYREDRQPSWPTRLYVIVTVLSTALVLGIVASVLLAEQGYSRLWFATGWAIAVLGVATWRTLAPRIHASVRDAIALSTRVCIVGANQLGQQLADELASQYEVVGYIDNGSDLNGDAHLPLLGPIAQLDHLIQANEVDEVVIALPADRREQVSRVIARGLHRRVNVKFLPGLSDMLPVPVQVQHLAGRPYIGFASAAAVNGAKRLLDLAVAAAAVILLTPLWLALATAIRLDSPGPVFYRQTRVGKDGRRFPMYKFRSMYQDADHRLDALRKKNEATGPLFKMRDDPRITKVGRILRRSSLDELPQLFNVLKGEMSLVGPRPPLPSEVEQYDDWHLGRLRAVPGMTGLWQVSGRSEVPFHDMVRLDLHYIRNWSLALDLEILVRTVPAVLSNRGAY